jgi:hypothetical protein
MLYLQCYTNDTPGFKCTTLLYDFILLTLVMIKKKRRRSVIEIRTAIPSTAT